MRPARALIRFIAKARLQALRRYMPVSKNILTKEELTYIPELYLFDDLPEYNPISRLSDNIAKSMRMMADIQKLREMLPGIDCGSCGAPNCRAFAEDVIRGNVGRDSCPVEKSKRLDQQNNKEEGK